MTSDSNNSTLSSSPSSSSSSNIDKSSITNPFRKNFNFSKKRIKSLNESFNNLSIKSKFKNYSSPSPTPSADNQKQKQEEEQQQISSNSHNIESPYSSSPSSPVPTTSNINSFYNSPDSNFSIDDTSMTNLSNINTHTSTIRDTNGILDDENKDLRDFVIGIPSRTSSLRTIAVRDCIDTDSDKNVRIDNDNTASTINTSILSDTNSNQTFNSHNITTNILRKNNNNHSDNHNHTQNHNRSNSNISNSNNNIHHNNSNMSKSYTNESKNKNNMNEIIKSLKEFKKLEHYLIKFNSIKKKNNISKTNILRLTLLPFLRTNSFSWSNLPYHLISDKLLLASTNCLNKWWDSLLNALLDTSPQFQMPSLDKSVYLECISRIISRWEWMFLSTVSLSLSQSNEIFNPILNEFKNLLLKTLEYSISRLNLKKVSLSISALVGKVFAYSFFHLPEVSKGLLFLLNTKLVHYENFYNYSILEKNQYSQRVKHFKNNLKFNNNLKLKNLKFQKKLIKTSKKFPIHLHYLTNSTINIRKTKFKHEKYLFNSVIPPASKIKGINDTKGLWVKRWCSLDNTDVFCSFLRHYFAIASFYFYYNNNSNYSISNASTQNGASFTTSTSTDNDNDTEMNSLSILSLPGYMFILTHIYEIIDYSMAKHVRTLNSVNNGQKDPNIKILATGYSLKLNNTCSNSTDPRKLNQQLSKLLRVIRDFLHNSRSSYEIKMSRQVINSFDLVTQSIAVEIGILETVKSSLLMDYWGRFIENVNLNTPNILDHPATDMTNQTNSTTITTATSKATSITVSDSSNTNPNPISNDLENIENCPLTINNGINWIFWCDVIVKLIFSENTTSALKSLSTLFQIWEYIPNHLPIKPLEMYFDNDLNSANHNNKKNKRVWISNPNESIRFNLSCWLLSISSWKLFFGHWLPLVRSYYMRLICWRLLGIRALLSDENLSNLIELNSSNNMINGDNFDTDNSLFDENNNSHIKTNYFSYLSTLDPNDISSNNFKSTWLGSYNNSLDPNCEAIRLMVKNRLEISFKCVKSMVKVFPHLDLKPCDPLANKKLIITPCNPLTASANLNNNINGGPQLLSKNSEIFASPFEDYSGLNPYASQSQEINTSSSSVVNQIQSPLPASNESSLIRTHPYEIFDDAVYSCASLPFGSSVTTPDSKNGQSPSPSSATDSEDPILHRSPSFSNSKTPERVSKTSSFMTSNSPVSKFANSLTGLSSSSSSTGGSDKKEAISNGLASAFKMFKNIRSSSSSGNLLKRPGKSSNSVQETTNNNDDNNKINTPSITVDTTNIDYDSAIPFDSDYQGTSSGISDTRSATSSTLLTSPPPLSSLFKVSNTGTAILDADDNLLKLQNSSPVDEFESQISAKLNSISTPITKPFSTLSMSSKSSSPSLLSLKTPSSPSSSLSSSTADLNSIFKEEINLSKVANPPPPPELNKRTLELAPPIYKFKLVTDEEIVSKRNEAIHFLNIAARHSALAYDPNMNRTIDLPTVTNTESLEGLEGVDIISFGDENANIFHSTQNNADGFYSYGSNGINNNNIGSNTNSSYLKGLKKQRLPTLLKINPPDNDLSSTRGLIALRSNSDSCTKPSPYSLNANNSDLSVSTFTYRDDIKNNCNSTGQYQVNGAPISQQQRPIYSDHMYSHNGSNGDNYTVHDGIVDDEEEEEYDQSDVNDGDDDDDEDDDEDNVLHFSIDRRNTIFTSRSLIRKGNGNILFNANDAIGTIQKLGNLGKALNEWSIVVDEFEDFTRAKLFTNGDCNNIDLENLKSFDKFIPILISETADKLNGY